MKCSNCEASLEYEDSFCAECGHAVGQNTAHTQPQSQTVYLGNIGSEVDEATLVRWFVDVGQQVSLDQPLVEVETDKVTMEIPSPCNGRVGTMHKAEGETVSTGDPLVDIV